MKNGQKRGAFFVAAREIGIGTLRSAAVFYLVILIVTAFTALGPGMIEVSEELNWISGEHNVIGVMSFLGMSSAIFLFVAGVAGLRADLRLCVQFGVSRRTAYWAENAVVALTAAGIAVLNEALTAAAFGVSAQLGRPVRMMDLYEMLYVCDNTLLKTPLGFAGHFQSALFTFCLLVALFVFGSFFTLGFWNLHGIGLVVGGLAIPVVLNAAIWLLVWSGLGTPLATWLLAAPTNCMLFCLLSTALFAALDRLLLEQAYIKAAGK